MLLPSSSSISAVDVIDKACEAWRKCDMGLYVGIDPGKDGAVAALRYDDSGALMFVGVYDTPLYPHKTGAKRAYDAEAMAYLLSNQIAEEAGEPITLAVLEAVHAMPGQGVVSMFSMGEGYGLWRMALVAGKVTHALATPQAWKKICLAGFGLKDKDAAYQVVSRKFFQGLSLGQYCKGKRGGLMDGRADAICLAEYATLSRLLGTGLASAD